MKQFFYSHQKFIGGPAYDESKIETTRQPRAGDRPEWELGMEVSVKFIAKKLAKMNCGAAMAEENFGMPAAEHFVYGAFDILYTGVWEWNPHCAVHTQLIKIALSDIHHYLDSWNNNDEHPQTVE